MEVLKRESPLESSASDLDRAEPSRKPCSACRVRASSLGCTLAGTLSYLNSQGNPPLERDVLAEEHQVDFVVAAGVAGPVRLVEIGGVVGGQVAAERIPADLASVGPDEQRGSRVFGVFAKLPVKGLIFVEVAFFVALELSQQRRVQDALNHRFGPDDQLGPGCGGGLAVDHEIVEELPARADSFV